MINGGDSDSEGYYSIQFIIAMYNLGLAHDNHTHYFSCYQQFFPLSVECGHFGHVIEIPRHHNEHISMTL